MLVHDSVFCSIFISPHIVTLCSRKDLIIGYLVKFIYFLFLLILSWLTVLLLWVVPNLRASSKQGVEFTYKFLYALYKNFLPTCYDLLPPWSFIITSLLLLSSAFTCLLWLMSDNFFMQRISFITPDQF